MKYDSINNNEYSIFNIRETTNNKTLNDICIIKNGIATLRDKIYIHNEKLYDEPCWKIITTGKSDKWCIYPYNNEINFGRRIF